MNKWTIKLEGTVEAHTLGGAFIRIAEGLIRRGLYIDDQVLTEDDYNQGMNIAVDPVPL